MKKALLIIDVQKSAVVKPEIAQNIEKLQYEYDVVFVSEFTNKNSPLLKLLDWSGYDDETLAFKPKDNTTIAFWHKLLRIQKSFASMTAQLMRAAKFYKTTRLKISA